MPGLREKDEQSQDNDQREDDYQKLFPKIGRDFVTREDLLEVINAIIDKIPGLSVEIGKSRAVALATEYKKNIEQGGGKKKYKDLVELDEEPEEGESQEQEQE